MPDQAVHPQSVSPRASSALDQNEAWVPEPVPAALLTIGRRPPINPLGWLARAMTDVGLASGLADMRRTLAAGLRD